jgi:hypothetical protein
MKREIASSLIHHEFEGEEAIKANKYFRRVNEVLKLNNAEQHEFYAEEDIRYTEFLEDCLLNQREKDIVLVSNLFYRVYSIVHVEIKILGKKPNPHDAEQIKSVHNALTRLGKPQLLTLGLSKKFIKLYLL